MTAFSKTAQVLAVALAHMHPLLPGKATSNLNKFRSTLESANIARIAFLRHGKTGPSTTGKDYDRLLTPEGQEQARDAGRVFGKRLMPFFSPVLVSSAPRTAETSNLFLESCGAKNLVRIKNVQELYDGTMQPEGTPLFAKIGYAPLRDYIENGDDQVRNDAQYVLGAYAHTAIDTIMDAIADADPPRLPSTLCVMGHAIYLPAAALGVASVVGCKDIEVAMSTNTREAEGYLITIASSTIEYLSRPDQ